MVSGLCGKKCTSQINMYVAIVLFVFVILALVAHPSSTSQEPYEDIPITPVDRPQNTKSCKLAVQETMKQVLQHCDTQHDAPQEGPTSSPHNTFPRLVTPTTPPAVYNPLGRPLYPQQFPPVPHNNVYSSGIQLGPHVASVQTPTLPTVPQMVAFS